MMAAKEQLHAHSVVFTVKRWALFTPTWIYGRGRWYVFNTYPDGVERISAGPFWSWKTCARVANALREESRNAYERGFYVAQCREKGRVK